MKGRVYREDAEEMKDRILKTVISVCEGRCDLIEIKKSESTNSLYFTITNGRINVYFRISDHPTHKKIKSLVIKKGTKISCLERFVLASISHLNMTSLDLVLDSLNGNLAVAY